MVIAILALLASIAIAAFNKARADSRDTKRIADIKQIATALEIYFAKYGQYPFNGSCSDICPYGIGYNEIDIPIYIGYNWDNSCGSWSENNPDDPFLTPLKDSEIMGILPDDPISKIMNCYFYTSTKTEYIKGYLLFAYLESARGENNCPISWGGSHLFCLYQTH